MDFIGDVLASLFGELFADWVFAAWSKRGKHRK